MYFFQVNQRTLLLLCALLLLFFSRTIIAADSVRILIIHAYSQEYPWTRGQHEGFITTLKQTISTSYSIKTEYLDTKRIPLNSGYAERYAQFIRGKYKHYKPNAIYVTDDNGLLFALNNLTTVFPNTPVFFSGVNNYSILTQLNTSRVTGVFEKKQIGPNLDLIKSLYTNINKIIVVGDNSTTYQAIEYELKQELATRSNIDVNYISDNHLAAILNRLRTKQHPVILLTTLGAVKNAQGRTVNIEETITQISQSGAAVVISMEDAYLFKGVLGGYVTSGPAQGRAAASLLLKHLSGTPIASLPPITTSPNEYIFDDRTLEQLQLTLPAPIAESATFLHPRLSLYQRYQDIILIVMVCLALALVAISLLYTLITLKKNKELKKQSQLLILQGNRLQESEEKYRLLFDRSDDPMMVIHNNRFVLANHAAGHMLNYNHPEELLNVHPASISPEIQPDGKPSHVKANDMMQHAYREGYHRFEWQHVKKDGERFLAEVSLTRIPYDKDSALFCIWHDITDWRNAELSLREKTTYLNSMLSASVNVGFIATDKQLNINYYNDIAAQIFGLKAHDLEMKNLSFFHEGAADDALDQRINMALQQAQDKGEYRFSLKRNNNDQKQYIDARISPIIDDTNHLQGYMLMAEDVTEQHEARKLIEFQATYDYLTNIPNRRTLLEQLTQALSRCARHQHYGAVLFIDLDNFKNINDTLGHSIGDMLLQQVSQDLTSATRNEDTVARLGGDEFVILLSETGNSLDTSIANVTQIADKLIDNISRAYIIEKNEIRTSISIGITLFPVENESADDILRQADTAMYQAKDAGRNTFRFFSPEMHQKVKQRMKLLDMMHQAIEKNEFQVYFQSQVDNLQQLIGVEALIRWNNPEQGMIFPDQFIPLAEESGLIEAISEFVLRYSVTTQLKWGKELPATTIPQISINVSAIQFQKKDFVDKIIGVVTEMGGDPNKITLELTESMLLGNIENTIKKMQTLREFGIRFSIDDFGTGYSSLAYLKRLPISEIKIDRSFIQDILTDANDSALVGTILSLARQLNMEVVAEGVENSEIFNALIAKECHIFQGYYFSKPISDTLFEQKYFKVCHPKKQ